MPACTPPLPLPLRRALIVEDDALFVTVYRETLVNAAPDMEIEVAHNGYAALACLAQQRPDLILLDLHMPDFSGFEFLDVIKRKPGLLGVPIIIVSSANATDIAPLSACPDVYVFAKPLRANLLHKLIRQILAQLSHRPAPTPPVARLQQAALEAFVGDDRELQGVIAAQFYALTPDRIAQLEACVRRQDDAGLHFWCHTMTGTSAMVGADALKDKVLALKHQLASANPVVIAAAASEVVEELRHTALVFANTFDLHDRHI